jgi:hypothetical protein
MPALSPFPPAPFTRVLLLRGAGMWAGTRASASVILLLLRSVPLDPSLLVAIPPVVAVLGVVEARRRNETVFLANLGVPALSLALLSAAPAVVGEAALVGLWLALRA